MMGSGVPPENSVHSCSIKPVVGVIVSGCSGRMGRRLLSLVTADPQLILLGGICPSAARRLSCKAPPGSSLEIHGKGLTQKDPLIADCLKVPHFVPELHTAASNVTEWSKTVDKKTEVENEAPVCTSLEDLLARPELTQSKEIPRVVVDFSHPAGTMVLLRACVRLHIPAVVGTTGFSAEQKRNLEDVAQEIPLCVAANFSLGINLLLKLVGEATATLGDQFDIELVEAHHSLKADAPSGTALSLLDSIANAKQRSNLTSTSASQNGSAPLACKNQTPSEGWQGERAGADPLTLVHGRLGVEAKRKKGEVGIHSLRLGSVVGEHSVIYASAYERVVLQHHAESRDVFAVGALEVVKWIASKPKGQYAISDMLCEKAPASQSYCRG